VAREAPGWGKGLFKALKRIKPVFQKRWFISILEKGVYTTLSHARKFAGQQSRPASKII
jgi:hypothetical protein